MVLVAPGSIINCMLVHFTCFQLETCAICRSAFVLVHLLLYLHKLTVHIFMKIISVTISFYILFILTGSVSRLHASWSCTARLKSNSWEQITHYSCTCTFRLQVSSSIFSLFNWYFVFSTFLSRLLYFWFKLGHHNTWKFRLCF